MAEIRVRFVELCRECVQDFELCRKLQLELRSIDALGLGDKDSGSKYIYIYAINSSTGALSPKGSVWPMDVLASMATVSATH
jgi:hypothetical protein